MATHDYVIANGTGAAVRSDLNNALAAIVSQNSGATAPATTYAYMTWADTTAGVYKMRNGANNAWISLWELDGTFIATDISLSAGSAAAPSLFFTGDTNTGLFSPGADTVALATAGSNRLHITSAGLVGVGTSSPSTTLAVAGGISGTAGANISGSGWGVLPYVANSLVVDSTAGQTRLFATGTDASTHGTFVFFTGTTDGTALERARIDSSGRLLVGTSSDSGGALLQVNGDRVRIGTAKTPASASATGTTGEICWDANYIYVCTATNTWKRTAIATW